MRIVQLIPLLSTFVTAFVSRLSSRSRSASTLPLRKRNVFFHSKTVFDEGFNEDLENSDGDALAKEFYRQLRERQKQEDGRDEDVKEPKSSASTLNNDDKDTARPVSEAQKRAQNSKPFSKPRVVSMATTNETTTISSSGGNANDQRKYTGQSDNPLFGNVPPGTRERSSPRQAMMEREFQLAGVGSGLGLGIQAGVAIFALIFYIYVGMSGGIVSGGSADFGGDDTLEYEQVIPVPSDTERTVWL